MSPSGRVTVSGVAPDSGVVVSSPPGIDCGAGGSCTERYRAGTPVTLTGVTAHGQAVFAFTGACSDSIPSCVVADGGSVGVGFVPAARVFLAPVGEADFGGLPGAEQICQADAADAGFSEPLRVRAWVGVTGTPAGQRLRNIIAGDDHARRAGFVTVDGRPFAANAGELLAGHLLYPVARTAKGTFVDEGEVLTGATADGGGLADNCSDWTDAGATV